MTCTRPQAERQNPLAPRASSTHDHTLEHTLKTKPDEDHEPVVDVRRIELVTGTGRRRQWSEDDKARIIVESLMPGANVSAIARRHGMSPQQLFGWRREARALFFEDASTEAVAPPTPTRSSTAARSAASRPPGNHPAFAPVVLVAPTTASPGSGDPPPDCKTKAGIIEIVVDTMIVRVTGPVDTDALAAVLAVVRRAHA